MFKKTLLTILLVLTLAVAFVLPSFAVEPLLDSMSFHWYNYIHQIYGGSYRSTSSGNSTVISATPDSNTNFIVITLDTRDFGLLSGESYNISGTSTLVSGSNDCNMYFAVVDGYLDNGNVSDITNWFFSLNLTTTSYNFDRVFSVPSDYSSPRIAVLITGTNLSTFSMQISRTTISYVNKVDTGDWTGDDIEFPEYDVSDDIEHFDSKLTSLFDFLHSNWLAVRLSIQKVSLFFSYIWNALSLTVPEYVFLIIFSLTGGAFVYAISRWRG